MKITSLRIERFGVWEDLNLPKISRGLNVFFGPNEAGKTTLMQFIRPVFMAAGMMNAPAISRWRLTVADASADEIRSVVVAS